MNLASGKRNKKKVSKKNLGMFTEAYVTFKNLSVTTQMLSCFIFLYIIMSFIIILIKFIHLGNEIDEIVKGNFVPEVIEDTLNIQRKIKSVLDKINYKEGIHSATRHLFYNKFLINELKQNDYFIIENYNDFPFYIESLKSISFPDYMKKINYFDLKFSEEEKSLENLIQLHIREKIAIRNFPIVLPSLIWPIILNINQIIIQDLNFNGIYVESLNFLMFNFNCVPNNSYYLKHPLKSANSQYEFNFSNFDTYIDPIFCPFNKKTLLINNKIPIEKSNWFYYYHKIFLANQREFIMSRNIKIIYKNVNELPRTIGINFISNKDIFSTLRNSKIRAIKTYLEKNEKNDIFTQADYDNYLGNKYLDYFVISHAQVVDLNKTLVPYLKNDFRSTFDFSVIVNTLKPFNSKLTKNNPFINSPLIGFHLYDDDTQILRSTKFMENNFKYAIMPKTAINGKINDIINLQYITSNTNTKRRTLQDSLLLQQVLATPFIPNIINQETQGISNEVLDNYNTNYTQSIYFQNDFRILSYTNFINKYLFYKYRLMINVKLFNLPILLNSNPCIFSDLEEYEKMVKIENNYDCLEDVCYYLNCDQNKFLKENYKNVKQYYKTPFCLCMPFFCYDHKTIKDKIPEKYKVIYEEVYMKLNENSYLYENVNYELKLKSELEEVVKSLRSLNNTNSTINDNIDFSNENNYISLSEEKNSKQSLSDIINSVLNNTLSFNEYKFVIRISTIKLSTSCKYNLDRKDNNQTISPYRISSEIFDTLYDVNSIFCRSYYYEETSLDNLINKISLDLNYLKNISLVLFGFLLLIIGIIFAKWLETKVNDFRDRISEMKNIHKLIINNEPSNKEKKLSIDNPKKIKGFIKSNTEPNKENENNSINYVKNNLKNDINEEEDNDNYEENATLNNEENLEGANENNNNKENEENEVVVTNYENKMKNEDDRFKDELQEIYSIIIDNINEFKLEFEIEKNVYVEDGFINRYLKLLNKKNYTESLQLFKDNSELNASSEANSMIERSMENSNISYSVDINKNNLVKNDKDDYFYLKKDHSNNSSEFDSKDENVSTKNNEVKKNVISDLSLSILYETISCEYLHMNQYYKNFYYRDMFQEKLVDMTDSINKHLYNDQGSNNELSDPTKIMRAMDYVNCEICMRWKNIFENDNSI